MQVTSKDCIALELSWANENTTTQLTARSPCWFNGSGNQESQMVPLSTLEAVVDI